MQAPGQDLTRRQMHGMVPGIQQILMPETSGSCSPVVNGLVGGVARVGLHTAAIRRLRKDEHLSARFATTWPTYELVDNKSRALLSYAKKLTEEPSLMEDEDVEALRR